MHRKARAAILGLVLLMVACGPAATATSVPPTPAPTATAMPTAPTTGPAGTTPPLASPSPRTIATPTTLGATTAAPTGKYGGRFVFALRGDVPRWDAITFSGFALHQPIAFVFNRLEHFNPGPPACQAEPKSPGIAESWRWLNDKTLEVRLRKDVRFQNKPPINGRVLTPRDVALSTFEAAKRPGAWLMDVNAFVASAEVVGQDTVLYRLKQPYSILPDRLAHIRTHIFPAEVLEPDMAISGPEELIGTGPFMLREWRAGVSLSLDKNPNYWEKGLPYVDGIDMKVMPDSGTRAAAFRSGRLDVLWGESTYLAQSLASLPGITQQECPNFILDGISFVVSRPPFQDVRLRRAVAMAIDFNALFKTVYGGKAARQYAVLPYVLDPLHLKPADYPAELRKYFEYNPEEARKLVREAGYEKGLTATYNYTLNYVGTKEIGEFLSSNLSNIGITLKLKQWEFAAFQTARSRSGEDPSLEGIVGFIFTSQPTLEEWIRTYHTTLGSPQSLLDVRDPDSDRLIEQAIATTDPEMEKAILKELQLRSIDKMWRIVIAAPVTSLVAQPWVKNIYFKGYYNPAARDFLWSVWLEK